MDSYTTSVYHPANLLSDMLSNNTHMRLHVDNSIVYMYSCGHNNGTTLPTSGHEVNFDKSLELTVIFLYYWFNISGYIPH